MLISGRGSNLAALVSAAKAERYPAEIALVLADNPDAAGLVHARDAGMPAPFACKAGVCATCRAKVISGKVEMAARYGLTDEEVAAGYVLTCQSVPVGAGVALDYDA